MVRLTQTGYDHFKQILSVLDKLGIIDVAEVSPKWVISPVGRRGEYIIDAKGDLFFDESKIEVRNK
jgi:hypothetical protein